MERREFVLQEDDSGRRLDRILRRLLPNRTLSQIYSALRKKLIKVNGKKVPENYITKKDDVLSVASFLLKAGDRGQGTGDRKNSQTETTSQNETHRVGDAASLPLTPYPLPLQKIFANENFLLINKPAGISVHGKGSLAEMVAAELPQNASLSFRAGPLHRLDKETTGLLAFSQSLAGAKWFSKNIKSHAIKKYYLGIVCGRLTEAQTWNDAIDGKEAATIATPLAIGEIKGTPISFVEFQILTGRKHQIRIHSAAHGHPLLGDAKHGIAGGEFFLHAYKIEFPQNDLGLPPELQAPLPAEFTAFLRENFKKLPQ